MEANEVPFVPPVVGVDMQVIDYYVVADADSYDKHYFIIQVQVEEIKYTVDRSYMDFVELDRLLKKLHPESAVPHLPLRAAQGIEKFLSKEAANQQDQKSNFSPVGFGLNRNSFSLTRDSLLASPSFKSSGISNASALRIPENSTEIIRNRMGPLTLYLTGIACYHELLTSYPLRNFLDEEYTSMLDLTIPPTLSEFDLLLLNSPVQNCVVHRVESYNIEVPADHYLLWRFKTAKYDIGFSIDINGKTRLPLTRYRASDQSICGALLVTDNCMVTAKWNNTYAKCKYDPSTSSTITIPIFSVHSKALSWSTRVVSKDEYQSVKEQALECEEEKIRFMEQRFALQRASVRHAMTLSGIVHGSIIQAEYHEAKHFSTKSLEENTSDLSQQRAVLLQDLEKAEETIEALQNKLLTLEQNKINLDQTKKIVTDSWKFTTQQLENCQKELEETKVYLIDLEATIQGRDREIHLLTQQIQESDKKEQEFVDLISTIIHNIDILTDHCENSYHMNHEVIERRDEELNQTLKNYDMIHDTDDDQQQSSFPNPEETARFESLLLLTQDLLDDITKVVAIDHETINHLKQVRTDLLKLIKNKTPLISAYNSIDQVEVEDGDNDEGEGGVLLNNSSVVLGPSRSQSQASVLDQRATSSQKNIKNVISLDPMNRVSTASINSQINPFNLKSAQSASSVSPSNNLVSKGTAGSIPSTANSKKQSNSRSSNSNNGSADKSSYTSKLFTPTNVLGDF